MRGTRAFTTHCHSAACVAVAAALAAAALAHSVATAALAGAALVHPVAAAARAHSVAAASEPIPAPASAWVTCGVPLARPAGGVFGVIGVPDGEGGMIVVWDRVPPKSALSDILAQRVLADGTIAPGWPPNGVFVCAAPMSQFDLAACADGQGGVLAAWDDSRQEGPHGTEPRVYFSHRGADGSLVPGWNADGNRVTSPEVAQFYPKIASDGAGGAWMCWTEQTGAIAVQHVTSNAAPALGWTSAGRNVGIGSRPDVVQDGVGAIVVWSQGGSIYGTRLSHDGVLPPGWDPGGNLLCFAGPGRYNPSVMPDNAGFFYLAMTEGIDPTSLWLQRFGTNGSPAPGWPLEGVAVSSVPGPPRAPAMCPDDSGGVYVSWRDESSYPSHASVSRVTWLGALAAGWPVGGKDLGIANTYNWANTIASDGSGGALVSRSDANGGTFIHHLLASGAEDPAWPADGAPLCTAVPQYGAAIVAGLNHGALIAVHDYRDTLQTNLYANFVDAAGAVSDAPANILARVERGRVRVGWAGGHAPLPVATVERRAPGGDWAALASVNLDTRGRWVYVDDDVAEGGAYDYRIAITQDGVPTLAGEIGFVVPSALASTVRLAPNPAAVNLAVSFVLRDPGPATLEVFDLSGRLVRRVDLTGMGPGRHSLTLAPDDAMPTGVYFLRVTQGTSRASARGVLVR